MSPDARRRAERRGRHAESLCVLALRLAGWSILARNFVPGRGSGGGQIDIIARRGGVLAVIEVKARADLDGALLAVPPRQQGRIARGAAAFLAQRPDLAGLALRFDVMAVTPWGWPRHLKDAWRDGA